MKAMNFKKITALCVSFVLGMSVCANAKTLEFLMGNANMYERAEKTENYILENAPYTKNDRTMVPVRIISERFGADVGWDGEKSQVSIVKGDKNILLSLNSDIAVVNGEEIKLDVSPEEFNGRTMVPLRFISETLEMSVRYIASTEQILISDEAPVLSINGRDITIDDYRSVMAHFSSQNPGVSTITELIKSVYSASSDILAEGNIPLGNDSDSVKYQISRSGVDYYGSNALTAPVAEIIEHHNVVMGKAVQDVEALNAQTGGAAVADKYNKDYITAKHILVLSQTRDKAEAKKLAEDILARIKKGEDFDTLMHKYGEDPGLINNPDGYTFTYGEMVKPFEEAAFALKEGEVSDIVETSYGYHIIKKEPLAPLTDIYTYNILMSLTDDLYNQYCSDSLAKADIIVHKTDEEIAELLK